MSHFKRTLHYSQHYLPAHWPAAGFLRGVSWYFPVTEWTPPTWAAHHWLTQQFSSFGSDEAAPLHTWTDAHPCTCWWTLFKCWLQFYGGLGAEDGNVSSAVLARANFHSLWWLLHAKLLPTQGSAVGGPQSAKQIIMSILCSLGTHAGKLHRWD